MIKRTSLIDFSQFPDASGDYTPEQRGIIDARLAKADRDIEARGTFGPFDTADKMIADIKKRLARA